MSAPVGLRPLARLLASVQRPTRASTMTGSITPGGSPVSVTISDPGDNAALSFSASAGQRVAVRATNVSLSGYEFGCCGATLRIYDSSNREVRTLDGTAWVWVDATQGAFLDTVAIPATGAYTLFFQLSGGVTGSATFTMYDVPVDPAPVITAASGAGGPPVTVATTTPGQNMAPTFSGAAGQRVSVRTTGPSFRDLSYGCCSATLRILDPNGHELSGLGGTWIYVDGTVDSFLDTVTLPVTGTYTIFVNPSGITTGSVRLILYDVPPDPAPVLSPGPGGASLTLATTTPGQNIAPTFAGTGGEQVSVRVTATTLTGWDFGCCAATLSIYDSNGSRIPGANAAWVWVDAGQGAFLDRATLPSGGTYSIVFNLQGVVTGGISFTVNATNPSGITIGVGPGGRGTHARTGAQLIGEPVNSLTGAFVDTESDLVLPGSNLSFAFTRSYTSIDGTQGRLGLAWTDSYSASLAVQSNGDVLLHGEDGQQVYYTKQADGSFAGQAGTLSTLSAAGGGYRLVRADQVAYAFDSLGRLTSMQDRNQQGLSFAYDGSGRLTSIVDAVGRQIALGYNAAGLLSRVTAPDGRSVSYGYTGNLLTSVTDPLGGTTTYAYDSGNRLASITDPNGHLRIRNMYGSDGRISQQLDALGNRSVFAWDPSSQTETVTDARGSVWKDVYQNAARVKQIDPLGNTTQFAYDGQLDVTSIVAPDGSAVSEAYDSRGNLTQVSSAALNATKSLAYDSKNDVTSVTDARGTVTALSYDASGNLTAVVQGGQTVAQYAYDAAGRRTASTDGRGGTTTYAYDTQGNLASVTGPLGARTTFTYDGAGRLVTRTDPLGRVTRYAYDALGRLVSETDPLGGTRAFAYDAAGNRTSVTDANGHRALFAYDAANRLVSVTAPDGGVTAYTYDANGNRLSVTDPDGHTTTNAYDAANRLVSTTTALGERTSYAYDANGNLASTTDPRGGTTTYTYDAAGRLLTATDAAGAATAHRYDSVGNEVSLTDPLGRSTTYAYDARGLLVSSQAPDGATTSFAYDANGNLLARTDPNGKTWTRVYDADDRLTSETTPLGEKTTYRYDAAGDLVATVDPRGNVTGADPAQYTTTSGYDADGRLATVTDPLGGRTSYTYDAVGNRTALTDQNGHRTSFGYDIADRLVSVTAPDSTVTGYAYDAAGNVVSRTDAKGHKTVYAYDADNRRVGVTSPLGQRWTFSYDAAGNLAGAVDANGNATAAAGDGTTVYTYDAVGRLAGIAYSDSTPAVSFTYDAAGNRVAMRDGSGTVTYSYDAANRLLQASRGVDVLAYTYDPAGNVRQRTYPGGTTASSTYDDDGRLAGVTSGGVTTSYAYDPAGHLVQVSLPDGYLESRTYDRAGRLVESKTAKGASVLADFKLTLDLVGNPTLVARTGTAPMTISYGYDARDRLTSACFQASCPKNNDPVIRWTYDAVGNRLTEKRGGVTTNYQYDAADELVGAGPASYTYDRNGNELSAGTRTFSYDLANRLVSSVSGSTATTYRYDGDGARLEASTGTSPAQKTSYVWDPSGPLPELAVERDGSGALLRRYLYGLDRISMTTPAGTFYYHYDGVGSVTNVTTAAGKTEWTDLYEPFGAVRTETKNDPAAPANPMKFAGEYQDAIGLYNLRAREYDPATGRFLAQDPLRWTGGRGVAASAYAYADDQPTRLRDPSGMGPIRIDAGYPDAVTLAATALSPDFDTCILPVCGWMPPVSAELRRRVVEAALLGWRKRDRIHYTQTSLRWQGIGDRIFPPSVPSYADCSSFATWTYFVAGAPDPNGYGYDPARAWTGTLGVHGASLGSSRREQLRRALPGDLVFYGAGLPWEHVAIYIGGGEVVSHGGESGPLRRPIDYRSDRGDIRSYLG